MFGNYIVRAEFANNLQLLKVVHVLFPIQFNSMNLWSNTNLGLPLIFWSGFSRLAFPTDIKSVIRTSAAHEYTVDNNISVIDTIELQFRSPVPWNQHA
jgi:hypothetical protein